MAEDLNRVMLVGRLTRDVELQYTSTGWAIAKMGLAVNRRRKQGDQWIDEANFFDITLFGKRAESLSPYLTKGTQLAIEGHLRQERWEQDGMKRSKVTVEATNIQLLGSRNERFQPEVGSPKPSPSQGVPFESYKPAGGTGDSGGFEDDIPF